MLQCREGGAWPSFVPGSFCAMLQHRWFLACSLWLLGMFRVGCEVAQWGYCSVNPLRLTDQVGWHGDFPSLISLSTGCCGLPEMVMGDLVPSVSLCASQAWGCALLPTCLCVIWLLCKVVVWCLSTWGCCCIIWFHIQPWLRIKSTNKLGDILWIS